MVGPLTEISSKFNQLNGRVNEKIAVTKTARREQLCPNAA
jgi:hypothetical protein